MYYNCILYTVYINYKILFYILYNIGKVNVQIMAIIRIIVSACCFYDLTRIDNNTYYDHNKYIYLTTKANSFTFASEMNMLILTIKSCCIYLKVSNMQYLCIRM